MTTFPYPIEHGNCGDGAPLTLGDKGVLADLFIGYLATPFVFDWDGDSRNELVASRGGVLTFHLEGTLPDRTPIVDRGLRWGQIPRAPHRSDQSDTGLCGTIRTVGDFDGDGNEEVILGPRIYSNEPAVVLTCKDGIPADRSKGLPFKLVDPNPARGNSAEARWGSAEMTAYDWNADGKLDLILATQNTEGYEPVDPGTDRAPEDQRDRYTRDGRWKGKPSEWSLHLFQNTSTDGAFTFSYAGAIPLPTAPPGGPLSAVNPADPHAGLLLLDYYGALWHLPLIEAGDKPRWGPLEELLSLHGEPFTRTANMTFLTVGDLHGEGRLDLVASDYSSNVYWSRYYGKDDSGRPVYGAPRKVKQRDPHINGGQFSVPTLGDWRGTGMADLVIGSVEGYIFWYKTLSTNPLRFAAPERVRCGDEEIRRVAKPHPAGGYHWGSSQGPLDGFNGGYSNPVLTDWDGDGLLDLLVGDMIGLYDWYPNRGTKTQPVLGHPMRLHVDGQPLIAPWRVQAGAANCSGNGLPDLITMDLELDLALYRRVGRDDLSAMHPSEKLRYEDGATIKTHGVYTPGGGDGRGRTKIQVVDWDQNGKWDLVLGVGPQYKSAFRGSYVLLLSNVGTNAEPVFTRPVPLLFESHGAPLEFWRHASHPAVVDWDGDGKWELVLGADEGYIWYFKPESFGQAAGPESLEVARGQDATWP